MDRRKIHRNIWIILIAAALLIVFVLMGNTFPIGFRVKAEDVIDEAKSEMGEAVIDDSQSRILFCNGNGNVIRIEKTDPFASEQAFYWDVIADKNAYYVIEYVEECGFVSKERIVKYSPRGVMEGVLLTRSYQCPGDGVMQPHGYLVDTDGKLGYAAFCSDDLRSIRMVSFSLEPGDSTAAEETVAEYENACGGALIYDLSIDRNAGIAHVLSEDGHLWEMQQGGTAERRTASAYSEEPVLLDGKTGEPVFRLDSEGKTFRCSFSLAIKTALFYGALVFLITSAVVFTVRSLKRTLRNKSEDGMKRLRTVLLAVAVSVGAAAVVGAYSYNMAKTGIKNESEMIGISAQNLGYAFRNQFIEAVLQYSNHDEEGLAVTAESIKDSFNTIASHGAENGHLQIPLLFALNENGIPVALAGPDVIIQRGVEYTGFQENIEGITGVKVVGEENLWGTYLTGITPLKDDADHTVGLFVLYTDYEFLRNVQMKEIISFFFGLLSAAIAVAFIITEGKSWLKCFKDYRLSRQEKASDFAVSLIRPMFFLVAATISADSAISALVAKELLAETAKAGNSLYLSLPMFASSLGLACGYLAFGALSARIGQKKTTMSAIVFSAIMYLLTSFMVSRRNFFLYILTYFLAYLGAMSSEVGIFRLILLASDDRKRADANRATAVSVVSANSLMGLAAGYTATYFGKAAVYFLSAVPMVIYGVIYAACIMKRPVSATAANRKAGASKQKMSKSDRSRAFVTFLFSPRIVALILFVIMPLCLASGYKSFFFPLFAEGEGYDVSLISTIIVIANAIVYFITPAFSNAEESLGYPKLTLICIAAIALTFGCFIFNKSMLWAATALIIIGMSNKIGSTCWKMLWPDDARVMGIPDVIGDSAVRSAYATCNVVKSPVIGVLKGFGNTTACAVLAAFSAVSAILFRVVQRRGKHFEITEKV